MRKKEDIHRINEDLAARFAKVEATIASAPTMAGLFEALVEGIEREFAVPFVWLTFMDRPGVDVLTRCRGRVGHFEKQVQRHFAGASGTNSCRRAESRSSNQNLQPFYKLMPPKNILSGQSPWFLLRWTVR